MNPLLTLFDEIDSRYLNSEELEKVNLYISSLPDRLELYRTLRDREVEIMQWVADQLQVQMPQESIANLERSIKNALLMLRSVAMAILLNDETPIKERYLNWAQPLAEVYANQAIDTSLNNLLNQRLMEVLGAKSMILLNPALSIAQPLAIAAFSAPAEEATNGFAIGW